MHIKPSTFIPAGTKITKCPTKEGKGKNVYALARAQEKELERAEDKRIQANQFAAALKAGFTAEEALKLVGGKK